MADPGPVGAPCDLGAWRELYAKLNVPWRDPATGAVESAPRRSTPAFAPPVTAPQAPPADGWRDDGAVESAFDSLIGADSEQREAAYIASIGQLCAQCDLLVSEAVKIRGLRKAKHQAESHALKEILRTHADEALGMGDIIARNSAMQVATVTSELRQAAARRRALTEGAVSWKAVKKSKG